MNEADEWFISACGGLWIGVQYPVCHPSLWGATYGAQLPLRFSSLRGRTDRRRLSIGRRRRLFAFPLLLLELRPMPFILPSSHGQFVCLDEDWLTDWFTRSRCAQQLGASAGKRRNRLCYRIWAAVAFLERSEIRTRVFRFVCLVGVQQCRRGSKAVTARRNPRHLGK